MNTTGYRRNGKLKACEPCRKGKLACDHGLPYCGRCTRRGTTERCLYHPAPMTKTRSSLSSASSNSTPPILNGAEALNQAAEAAPLEPLATGTLKTPVDPVTPGQPKIGWKDKVYRRSTRYYGPTSFSAVFSENKTKLKSDLLDIGEDLKKHPGAWPFGEPLLGRYRPSSPTIRENQTIRVLRNIPSKEICEKLFRPFQSASLDTPLIRHVVESLWSNFEAELTSPRTDERLIVISDVLFENEETPLPSFPDEGIEWLNTFSGRNLRFEVLGMVFCFFGIQCLSLQDWDPLFKVAENEGRDRKQTAWRMKECAELCLKMCEFSETVNHFVSALILNLKRLESGCTGDETFSMRQLHGALVTMTIASGLHRLPGYAAAKFTASLEYRRRLFCEVYANDKTNASLNGVPPLLTRRFCDLSPCLDLPDEALYFSEYELSQAISQLDSNGWNKSRENHQYTTLLRAKVQHTSIREEILELALGVNVDVSQANINDLHIRTRNLFESLPPQLHYYSEGQTPKESIGPQLFDQAYLFLQYLQNRFLIDRLAIARGLPNEQGLLETSMNMMDISLMFWMKRDQLMDFTFVFDWIITYYTVPAAGVICVELLKNQSPMVISRSDAIQKLTLFIAFLEWIRETDGNYALARRLRKVVKRVLDYVLDSIQKEPLPSTEISVDPISAGFEEMGDLDWLNTVDWTQGSWIDFN